MKNATSNPFAPRPKPPVLSEELRIEKSLSGEGLYLNYYVGSDCYPYKVCEVSPSGKTVLAKQMGHRFQEGAEDYSNRWEYFEDERYKTEKFTLRKSGVWKKVGKRASAYPSWSPRYYRDYSF